MGYKNTVQLVKDGLEKEKLRKKGIGEQAKNPPVRRKKSPCF